MAKASLGQGRGNRSSPSAATCRPCGKARAQQGALGLSGPRGCCSPPGLGARAPGRGFREAPGKRILCSVQRGDLAAQQHARGGCSSHTLSHLISHMGKRKAIRSEPRCRTTHPVGQASCHIPQWGFLASESW